MGKRTENENQDSVKEGSYKKGKEEDQDKPYGAGSNLVALV